ALDFSSVMTDHFGQMIVDGTVVTLELALGAWLLAMFIALALVVVRLSNKRTAQLLVAAYVSYHRNVPTLIQLMMWYFAIPTVLPESLQMWINGFNA
ncbi:ABC transporter permease subunit, partial [Pectobacterium versatile]|nr:ABC transporter permease subunit [Pectobacterium versatile]